MDFFSSEVQWLRPLFITWIDMFIHYKVSAGFYQYFVTRQPKLVLWWCIKFVYEVSKKFFIQSTPFLVIQWKLSRNAKTQVYHRKNRVLHYKLLSERWKLHDKSNFKPDIEHTLHIYYATENDRVTYDDIERYIASSYEIRIAILESQIRVQKEPKHFSRSFAKIYIFSSYRVRGYWGAEFMIIEIWNFQF